MVSTLSACDDVIRLLIRLFGREGWSGQETVFRNRVVWFCCLISGSLRVGDSLGDDRKNLFLHILHVLEVHVILKIHQVFLQFIDHFLLIVRRLSHHGVVHGAVAVALQHHHCTVCQFGFSVLFLGEPFFYSGSKKFVYTVHIFLIKKAERGNLAASRLRFFIY